MNEFTKCYPVYTIALEDVNFNHRDKRWGKNFSTIEVGKHYANNWIRERASLQLYNGWDTQELRKEYGYKKSSSKNAEVFNSHCSDDLTLATDIYNKQYTQPGRFLVADDGYRPIRRKLHDTQPIKGGIRNKMSRGNFKCIRKGTMCNFGQVCGGIKQKIIRTYDFDNKRLSKNYNQVAWLSHHFKVRGIA
jgi:hypothetical protein